MHSIRGRERMLQRCSTVDNLRHPRDGLGPSIQKRNSQLFSWDDEFWKRSNKGQHSLASSASTFEEVESLCWSKSSSDSMCNSQQQWTKFGCGGPQKGTQPACRLISRQSSTTSTSTSRSSGMKGDASAGDALFDFNPDRCQLIADTLLESMDFLGAQGNLDMADKYYLEKIFKRVLEWNNGMPVSASKTVSKDCANVADFRSSKNVLGKQERHLDANSPRSHAALRERLLKLKHKEQINSRNQHHEQANTRASQQNSHPQTRRLRDLIVPDEDDADTVSHIHFHPFQSSGKRYGLNRETSYSSRDTLSSSKAFSENSTSKYSGISSMSSISMDNGSLGGASHCYSETHQISHQPSIATLLPQCSIQPTGSFESTASPSDHFLRSQACVTSHAERVLMGLGFDAAEGFLPERFLKDWYSKISKAQTELAVSAELKRQESIKNPSANADVINERPSQTLMDNSISRRSNEASNDLPSANDQYTKLERLKEYIAAYTSNISSIDEEKEMPARQSSFSRQKSLPLCLETLSKLERKCRLSGMDPFDKETKLQMFISDNKPHSRNNPRSEHSPKGKQSQRAGTGCSSESLNTDCRDSSANKSTHRNLNTHLEQTIGSLQQIMHRQLVHGDLSDTSDDIHDNSGMHKHHSKQHSPTNRNTDGASERPPRNIYSGNLCGARALRSPTRQIAIDVCDPVCKADRSDNNEQAISEQLNGVTSKVDSGRRKNIPDAYQRMPHKIESLASKDSEEVANIMENQPNRDLTGSKVNQHPEKVNGGQGRPLKSALKHVEPAMVSIVLEDTDQGEGRCNADIVSVSQEGIHLVIPLSASNSFSLSPIPQSPVTVIEVGLDNQQDSLDTEGTYSSKDTEDDSFCHPTMFYAGEYSAMKPKHDRRRSLSSLSPHPEHPQRRRSTGIMSPIPCQLSLIQVPNSSKGHSRRRLSLEVPALPEIRHLLEKQKGLLTNQSKESLEEPKKSREKRRASFSEAEPTIINDVLARQRCLSPRYQDSVESCLDNMTNQDMYSGSQDQGAGQTGTDVTIIKSNGSREMLNVAGSEKNTPTSVGHEANNCSTNFERRVSEHNEHKDKALLKEANVMQQCSNTNINLHAIQERDFGTTRSMDSSPRSTKSDFKMTSKTKVENNILSGNGYFSDTDAEALPVSVNPNLTPRPTSTIARYLEAVANSIEADTGAPMSDIVSKGTDRKSSPTMQFPDHNPLANGPVNSLQQKVKAPMIGRAVEVNNSARPYSTQDTPTTCNQPYQSEYYYACDKSTQCTLTGSGYDTPAHMMCRSISASTQTGVCKHEMSSQTTDVLYFVNNNVKIATHNNENTQSKGVNTVVCLMGREHGNNYFKRPTNYTTSNFNCIDETIREIDAELSNIDIRNYQRMRGMYGVQLAERSYPSFSLEGLTDCMYQRVSSNCYEYQAPSRVTRERTHRLALKRCAPSNWHDATELMNTAHSNGNMSGRTQVSANWLRNNEQKIIDNGFNDEVNVSLIPGVAKIPSNVSTSTECPGTDTDDEEYKQTCIQHANKDFQSSRFFKYKESSPHDNYRISVKSCNRGAGNSSTVEDVDNKSKPVIEFINPLLLHTSVSLEANKDYSTKPLKASNEAPEDTNLKHTTCNSKDITLKAMNSGCDKVIVNQSNACLYDHKQEKEVTPSNLDLSSARNSSKRQKLINTKQMIRIGSSELTPIAQSFLRKDQADNGHSKLSRLKYNQSSHRSPGSSFEVELDFVNAAEPKGMFKCMDPTSQVTQYCKQQTKKQKDAPDILDSALSDKATQQARHISTSNIGALSRLDMPINVSNSTRSLEQNWPDSSSTSIETQRHGEQWLDSRNTAVVENAITGTGAITCSLVADTVARAENPCVSNITEIKLENASNGQGTRDNATTAINRAGAVFLQVPGSPEHLFNRARYPSGSSTSSPTTSSVTSSKTLLQENDTTWVEDNKMSVTQVADSNVAFTDRPTGVGVLLAAQEQEGIRDGCQRKRILTNGSGKAFSNLSSLEKSCDECSEASVFPVLSNDSVFDVSLTENRVNNARREGCDATDLVAVKVANFRDITTCPPVFNFDVLKSNNAIQNQPTGVWGTVDEETCDVDSNQSVAGSELSQDIDDMDVMEIDNRKQRSNSESSYSEPLLDLSDTLSLESDINDSTKKNVNKTRLLTTGYNSDDLLQVSDIGGSTAFQRKSSGENLSLSPSDSTRGHERHRNSPSNANLRSPSREFPPEPIQCIDSDDELDSETELKIRERLRQVRRESRRNSDNWEAVQSVLLSQNKTVEDSLTQQEESSHNALNQSDNATSLTNPLVSPSVEISCPLDEGSGDECDQEISRINHSRPAVRKLIKMSSDPVDKDMYCRSSPSFPGKEKATQRNSPVIEESLKDIENASVSFNANTTGDRMGVGLLSETTVHVMSANMSESLKQDVQVLENNAKVWGKLENKNEAEGSCSVINDPVDLITNGNNDQDNNSVARILEVEFINDDLEKDTYVMTDRQDSLQEPSTNILDELEVIALFNKIDGYESSVNPYADYSSETSTSVEFKLSQISEEDTQSEDNTSDESRRHIWQVRSRFVLPQDTLESTLDGITRQDTVGSTSSYHSDNTDSVALVEETTMPWSSNVTMDTASDSKQMQEVTSDATNELQHDGTHSQYVPIDLDLSYQDLNTEIENLLSHPIKYQMEHHQQDHVFSYSEDCETLNSQKSPNTNSHLNQCDTLNTNECSSEKSSVFCDVLSTANADSAYETRILEWKTDVSGKISTTVTNTRVVKTVHLNSNDNNPRYTNVDFNSAAEMSEGKRHKATIEFLVGDHRREQDTAKNHQQQMSDQSPGNSETNLQTVPNGKYNTDIEDTLAVNALMCLWGNHSPQKVTNNTVEDLHDSELNGTISDTRNDKEVYNEKDVTSDKDQNNRTVLFQKNNENNEGSDQNDLKNKVRAMFLIDRMATSNNTVQDNNINDERCINRTQEDAKNKILSTFITDTSDVETVSEVAFVDVFSKDNDNSEVQHGLKYGKENLPATESIIHTESEALAGTELDGAGKMSRKSKINVDVFQKALASFFSETVDLEGSFEGNDELTDTDYRLSESPAQKQLDFNVRPAQTGFNSSSEVVLAGDTNYSVGDCKSTISLPQAHLSNAISYVVPNHDVLLRHMSKETTSNRMESGNNMDSGKTNLTRDIHADDPRSGVENESNISVSNKVNNGNGINDNNFRLPLNKNERSCDEKACEGIADDNLKDNSGTVSLGHWQATSICEADVADDIKKHVKAMFLLSRHSDSNSSDSIPLVNLASSRGPSSPSPTKLVYNPAASSLSSPPSPTIPADNPTFYTESSTGSPTKSIFHVSSVFSDSRKEKTDVAKEMKKRFRAMFLLTGESDSCSSDSNSADNPSASGESTHPSSTIPVVDLASPRGSSPGAPTKPIVHVSTIISDNKEQEMNVAEDMKKRVRAMYLLTNHSEPSTSYSKSTDNPAFSRETSPPSPANPTDNTASSIVPSHPSPTNPADDHASPSGSSSASLRISVDNLASSRGSSTRSPTKPIINSSPGFSNNIEQGTDVADIKKHVRAMFLLTGHRDTSSSDLKCTDNHASSRVTSLPSPTKPKVHVSSVFPDEREQKNDIADDLKKHVRAMFLLAGKSDCSSSDSKSTDNPTSSRETSSPSPTNPTDNPATQRGLLSPSPTELIDNTAASREPSPPSPTEPTDNPTSPRITSSSSPTIHVDNLASSGGSAPRSPPIPVDKSASCRAPSLPSPTEPTIHVSGIFSDYREQGTDVADDMKKRVRAMFLLTGEVVPHSNSKSPDNLMASREPSLPSPTDPTDNRVPYRESSPTNPIKPIVNGSALFSDNNEYFPKSCVTSSPACSFSQKEDLNEQCETVNSSHVTNSEIQIIANSELQIPIKDMKSSSSGVNRSTKKNLRVLNYRNSLLRLHEQMNVFSSIGSDSDSELTSALKNQGDYDIRMRDLALGRISSDNNDEEETEVFTDSCKRLNLREAITTVNAGASVIVQTALNVSTRYGHHLEDSGSSGSGDTLVNSNSNSVEFDVNGLSPGTDPIYRSESLEIDVCRPVSGANVITESKSFDSDVTDAAAGTNVIAKSSSLDFDVTDAATGANSIAESFNFEVTDAASRPNVISKSRPVNIDESGSSPRTNGTSKSRCQQVDSAGSAPVTNDISSSRCLEIRTAGSAPVTNDISSSRCLEISTSGSAPGTNSISESSSLEFDLTRSTPGTNRISKTQSLGLGVAVPTPVTNEMSKSRYLAFEGTVSSSDSNSILTPKVIIQQPSDEQLTLKPAKTNSTSTTMISNSDSDISVLSDAKENVNHNENRSDPGQRRHYFNKRCSGRPGASSSWLRNNPHANFLSPDSALRHSVQYSHAANHSPYTRIENDLHPELSYLDIVSKLKQQDIYKTKPTRKPEVELVISPPDTKDRRSLKTVRFTLGENIPSTMTSEHTKDRTSKGTK